MTIQILKCVISAFIFENNNIIKQLLLPLQFVCAAFHVYNVVWITTQVPDCLIVNNYYHRIQIAGLNRGFVSQVNGLEFICHSLCIHGLYLGIGNSFVLC